jgi:hypothetical protein
MLQSRSSYFVDIMPSRTRNSMKPNFCQKPCNHFVHHASFLPFLVRHLLVHPPPKLLPLPILQTHLLPLIPHNLELHLLPLIIFLSTPARFPHQANQRLFLCPALLDSYIRQIRRAIPPVIVREGYAQAVCAERPVEGRGGGFEVCEEGDGTGERGEFARGDGVEACVVEGAVITISELSMRAAWVDRTYEVKAYLFSPSFRSCASNVPMQPRRRRSPLLLAVFQVTKSGESSTVEARLVALLAWLMPLGVELALWRLEELPVEGEGARSRDIAAGLKEVSLSAGTSSGSVVVGSSVYFAQRASTSGRVRLGRFSKLATRLSKQYAQ